MSESNAILINMVADISAAYLQGNALAQHKLPDLIRSVHMALSNLSVVPAELPKAEPAVSIKKSVQNDAIACLCCGKQLSMLKRHILKHHGMTILEYRSYWGLSKDYPMTAPAYAARRSAMAKHLGLGKSGKRKK
jgi:predicted transcriptional regulator